MALYCRYCHTDYSLVQTVEFVMRNIVVKPGDQKKTREDVPESTMGYLVEWRWEKRFWFKTPFAILNVGPSRCRETYFTEWLLLDHLEELFVNPPTTINYYYRAWQDGFPDMKEAHVQFHKESPESDHLKSWFPKGGLLVLDDLMAEGGEDQELLDLVTKHSHHQSITVLYLCQEMFPPGKYAKSIASSAHYILAFKNPRDQLGMTNLLLQAFPTCWQDMMDVYEKVAERPFKYTVLDVHSASDDRQETRV